MPLDPNIALSFRPPQIGNQLVDYGQIMQIQNAGNQNRLAEIQYRQALRAEADNAALRNSLQGVDISTPEGLAKARNALLSVGNIKGAQELDKNALATKKTRGEISKQDADLAYQKLGIVGGALGPLLQNPSRQAITETLQSLAAQGIEPPPIPIPQDDALLPSWVKQVAALTDKGLKALEAFSPKVDMTNLGATVQPTNTNALAGPIGTMAGAAPLQTTPQGFNRNAAGDMTIDPGYLKGKSQIAAAGAPNVNMYSQTLTPAVDAEGNPVFVQSSARPDVPPRRVADVFPPEKAGQIKSRKEQAEEEGTLVSVKNRIASMTKLIQGGAIAGSVVGPLGMASRIGETIVGAMGDVSTPAIDFQNEQALLLADVRKMVEKDPNLSKDERDRLYQTLGGGTFQTPGSALRAVKNIADYVEHKATVGAASRTKKPSGLPAVEKRVKDRVYPTPSGKMKWTGTGWLPAN